MVEKYYHLKMPELVLWGRLMEETTETTAVQAKAPSRRPLAI